MSHLWPELLRITLCPDQVILERGKLVICFSGVEPRYFAPEIIPVEPRHEPTLWAAPLAVLGIALDGLPERPHDTVVILSNYFVHYPPVQASVSVPTNLLQPDGYIDDDLRNALRILLVQHDCRLATLQPRIMAVGADLVEALDGEPGWLVLVEDGLASIGLIQDGELCRFRNLCMWPASSVELLTLLDQEASLAGLEYPPRNLLLWRRDESDEVIFPLDSGWQITRFGEQSAGAMLRRAVSRQMPLSGAQA